MHDPEPKATSAALIVLAVLLVPIIGGAAGVFYIWKVSSREPRVVHVDRHLKANAVEGERLTLTVVLNNRTDKAVTLQSIELSNSWADGFAVQDIAPRPEAHRDGDPFQLFTFSLSLDPGEDARVVFELLAVNAGEWSGDMDVRLSSEGTTTKQIATSVAPPGGAGGDPIEIDPGGDGGIGGDPDDGPGFQITPPVE